MDNIDWFQFQNLAVIFIGVYFIFELIRLGLKQAILAAGGRNSEHNLYITANVFSILRVIILTSFFVIFIFTAVFNRTEIAVPHSDMGHDANVEALGSIEADKLKSAIENKQMKSNEKSLSDVNSESEKNYKEFLKQNSPPEPN